MSFNSAKVEQMVRGKGIKARQFFSIVYPERSGNASFSDIRKNDNPKAETIERIADLLQCPIDDLFDRSETVRLTGDHIEASDNSTVFKGNNSCDPRLLAMIESRDRQIDRCQSQLDKAQEQTDRLLDMLEGAKEMNQNRISQQS